MCERSRGQLFKMLIFNRIFAFLYFYLRPFIKWFLHKFTRLCELQRICYGAEPGASRTKQVERSLRFSKCKTIHRMVQEFDELVEFCNEDAIRQLPSRAVSIVTRAKRIKQRSHPDFPALFGRCVIHIWSYKQLMYTVECLRSETFDSDNLDHEKKLFDLWNLIVPEEALEGRITKQWQQIGFQVCNVGIL